MEEAGVIGFVVWCSRSCVVGVLLECSVAVMLIVGSELLESYSSVREVFCFTVFPLPCCQRHE